ncbi:Glutamyl-tRNA(Gln) amidotransferase subunit B [Cladobotryum mycophilum]|uniref:Glutamyl-tRNA(Gln) amidotransferase subunit B n=1 Tax=Cladobotryum mycophilum TaxID=491253 RepID=A0ABR0SUX1_9HYPO
MSRTSITALSRYLLQGQLPRNGCIGHRRSIVRRLPLLSPIRLHPIRCLQSSSSESAAEASKRPIPLRKQLKDEAKQAKKQGKKKSKSESQTVDGWELTVGIEIHAQLNTPRKLFSPAATSFNDEPNSHVAFFDVAMPGSQPLFQKETLIPAIRAALALNCDIQPDGISPEDGESVTVRIKQVQLEQDTAKTLAQVDGLHWLDFNRVGVPLIEVITEPDIHHPRTAAVLVRKIQLLLNTVDSCVSGMETGGLRADVNVSVRRTDDPSKKLGTRTEIKNLSTIKAVEDAIISERDRQIRELEAGGVIAGETRGWSIGSTETRRLRGKEGEVDYRYMPDPDLAPLVIGDDVVQHLQESLAVLPDAELDKLVSHYGLTPKDALSLITLDNGARVQYFYRVLALLEQEFQAEPDKVGLSDVKNYATLAGNWIIHEPGRLTTYKAGPTASGDLSFTQTGECDQIPGKHLSQLLYHLYNKHITGKVAKELLLAIYLGELESGVLDAINANDLWFKEISHQEYMDLADAALKGEEKVLQEFSDYRKYPQGKLMYLVGKMMRLGPTERIDPLTAETVMRERIEQLQTA